MRNVSTAIGPLLHPGDDGFTEATEPWNAMVERRPALAVRARGTADVVAAIQHAREHDLPLSVRGRGHNIAGTALAEGGLAIDLSLMREMRVDSEARTATVQPGCQLGDVDRATQAHGLATPLGFISEVGVSGLTLGGGLGYLTRRFGWTVDNLLEVEIVTADGQVRRASRDEHADLFWGVRGAGANLGAVTELTFRLHEVGPMVHGGLIAWPVERAAELTDLYANLVREAPRELAVWRNLMPLDGQRVCAFAVCFSGDLSETAEVLAPIHAIGDPVADLLRDQPYVEVQSYLDEFEPRGLHYYWKTGYAAELSDALLEAELELFAECPIPDIEIGSLHIGGALNEHPEDDGAVGNRDARHVIGVNGMWEPDEPRGEEFVDWIRAAFERLRPETTGRNYVNFQTADEDEQRVRETYGENFDRLLEVKRRYDPDNVFSSNRNVRPFA
jgi:FAD/FMN-containing dehydrogenase